MTSFMTRHRVASADSAAKCYGHSQESVKASRFAYAPLPDQLKIAPMSRGQALGVFGGPTHKELAGAKSESIDRQHGGSERIPKSLICRLRDAT
jgi:hypothetical protein